MSSRYRRNSGPLRRRPTRGRSATLTRFRGTRWPTSNLSRQMGAPIGMSRQPRYNCTIPSRMNVTIKYCERIVLNPTVGTADNYVFAMNNAYDPNVTGTGHQPAGYDTWTTLYNRYVVTRSSIKITVFPAGVVALPTQNQFLVAIVPSRTASTFSDIQLALEQDYVRTGHVALYSDPVTVSHSMDVASFVGLPGGDDFLTNDYYGGNTGGGPTYQPTWTIVCQCGDTTSNGEPIPIVVNLQYQVTFLNPNPAVTS